MRMIVSCSKGILGSDDDMSVIKLATNLRSEMSLSNNKTLVTLLKVDYNIALSRRRSRVRVPYGLQVFWSCSLVQP